MKKKSKNEYNIKQFLKPDRKKTIIAIILFLSLPFPVYSGFNCMFNIRPCSPYFEFFPAGIFTNLAVIQMNIINFRNQVVPIEGVIYPLILFLFSVIASYLLSCFIFWSYDKFKSIKVKK